MPSDNDLTQELIDHYNKVRRFFIDHPNREAIGLFLRSYGEGDGWGVYQLVENFFLQCKGSEVKLEIKKVLEDITIPDSVRYWVTQVAAAFIDEILRGGLEISQRSKNTDIKDAAEMAISLLDE